MEKALVITGLTKCFLNGRGINDINLTVHQGDLLGILGPNGAGKTTLLKCMTGLVRPNSGKIEVFGIDIGLHFKEAIRPVSALIGPTLGVENMTPCQNLKMAWRLYPELPKTRMDELLEITGLRHHKHEKLSTFSMGMKQRFGIASALLSNPLLILLDEPTNGLDLDGLLLLRETIQEIASRTGVTFVISSYHLPELEKLCSHYCFLLNGHATSYVPNDQSLEEIYVKLTEEAGAFAYTAG